ncbi:hypothetical protein G3I13_01835 [Streptomyces sp. SID6673]|nr:hypothetical protein [Streptomyces sp. SID11726]NDZ94901.1 hypothetical protein [Streptomyces sp. SID11726]NEB23061.1 hypothetical protein [Streptomyces sp. SID6673]
MGKWIELGRGKYNVKPPSTVITSRFETLVEAVAIRRVAKREGIKVSSIIYTAVMRLPEIREEIATIKREKRGERTKARRTT